MTTLTAATSRRRLFFAWLKTNLIAGGISLLFFAGAGILALLAGMSGTRPLAQGGAALVSLYRLVIAAWILAIAGVAWLGAAQAKRLGFSRRAWGLVMLLAAVAAVVSGLLLIRLNPMRGFSSGSNLPDIVLSIAGLGIGGLVLGLCQARLTPWLRPHTQHWALATGLGWFLSALAFGGAYVVLSNSNNVDGFQSFGLAGAALVVMIIVTGLAYAFLRSAAPVQPDPASAASAPPA